MQYQGGVITSGGGFSDHFPRPIYQNKSVQHYLNNSNVPSESFFNKYGRAIPGLIHNSCPIIICCTFHCLKV